MWFQAAGVVVLCQSGSEILIERGSGRGGMPRLVPPRAGWQVDPASVGLESGQLVQWAYSAGADEGRDGGKGM